MVYTRLLPIDRTIKFPEIVQDALAASAIDAELEDMMYASCGVHITITPDKEVGLPQGMQWYRFQWIKITIDKPSCVSRRSNLAGVTELIRRLQTARPKVFPYITIEFCEWRCMHMLSDAVPTNSVCLLNEDDRGHDFTNYGRICGRYIWSRNWQNRHYPANSSVGHDVCLQSEHRWLRTHDDGPHTWGRTRDDSPVQTPIPEGVWNEATDPVFTTILNKFMGLPACRSATVRPLHGLDLDGRCP